MKSILKNNKGSSLVLLVMAIAVISLLGTSVLGVTMMNYKIKKTNTNIKSSFYMAETGLDKAYERAYEVLLEAVMEGNTKAQEFINDVTNKFIELNASKPDYSTIDFDGLAEDGYYKGCITIEDYDSLKNTYNIVLHNGENGTSDKVNNNAKTKFKTGYKDYLNNNIKAKLELPYEENLKVEVKDADGYGWAGDILNLGITSTYDRDIKKITTADLVIGIPEFKEPYKVVTETISQHPLWTYGLIADNLNVEGNLSVKDNSVDAGIYGKTYISNNFEIKSANINFKSTGDLVVRGGEGLNDDNGLWINGADSSITVNNVYTKNIIMDGAGTSFKTETNKNYDIYVKDDLEMNNTKQTVDIKGSYYGFAFGGESVFNNKLNSAIIINSSDIDSSAGFGSSLTISDKLYLFGTSYVKNTDYATGESISIPGNYIAYTKPLNSGTSDGHSIRWDNVDYVYIEPLPNLVYKFLSPDLQMQPWNKADYFNAYNAERNGAGLNLANGNIKIGDQIKNTGIVIDYKEDAVNKSRVIPSGFNLHAFMSESADKSDKYNNIDKYNDKHLKYYITSIKAYINSNADIKKISGTELLYINKNGITINDGIYTDGDGDHPVTRGLIVTSGDVTITGEFNFTGAIICGGDVKFNLQDSKDIIINHDINYIAKLVLENNLDDDLFYYDGEEKFTITNYKKEDGTNDVFNDKLRFKNWHLK